MGILTSFLANRVQASAFTTRDLARVVWGGGYASDAGVVMSPTQGLLVDAVYSCTRVLSETLAKLPLILYRRTDRGRERATDHPLYRTVYLRPNSWQTRFNFVEMMQAHTFLAGNSYAVITRIRGRVSELLPIPSHRVKVCQDANLDVTYRVDWPDGTQTEHTRKDILHISGLAYDGLEGRGFIDYCRHLVGLAREQDRTAGRMVRQGLKIGGTLEHPGRLLDPAVAKRLQDSFNEQNSGPEHAGKAVLLEEGMKFNRTALTADEAQFLESMQFTRSRIAGAARIPPHLIGDLTHATFSNIEHQGLSFVTYTMGPWLVRWEQQLNVSLLTEAEQEEYYFEFLVDSLLRGDIRARYTAHQSAVLTGWMSRNEVRERENMNTAPGLDTYLEPQNMRLAGEDPERDSGRDTLPKEES